MSHTKRTIEAAAEALDVPVDELTSWLMGRDAGPYAEAPKVDGESVDDDLKPIRLVKVEGPAYVTVPGGTTVGIHLPAGKAVEVAKHNVSTYRLDLHTAPHLVSEDDYRGVAADLIARWADDHMDATTALASLNLASVGMPVTTPSRRALDDVRDLVTAWRDGNLTPQDAMDAIARRTEA